MPSISQRPNGKFRAQIRLAKYPKIEMDFDKKEDAEVWAFDYEARLKGLPPDTSRVRNSTIRAIADLYFKSPTHLSKKTSTKAREVDAFVAVDRLIGSYAADTLAVYEIQRKFFDIRCQETYRDKVISGHTLRLEKALLSQLYKYAEVRNLVRNNPITGKKYEMTPCLARDVRIDRAVQIQLYEAAWQHCVVNHSSGKRRNQTINLSGLRWLMFMFDTSCRPGESARIRLEWIYEDFSKIAIPSKGNKNNIKRILLVNMVGDLEKWVADAKAVGSPYLFYSRSGNGYGEDIHPYNYAGIWKVIKPLVSDLDPKATPHVIRHECISRLVESTNLNLPEIAALVGMKSYDSLKPYIHLRVDGLQDRSDAHRVAEKNKIQTHPEAEKLRFEHKQKAQDQANQYLQELVKKMEEDYYQGVLKDGKPSSNAPVE